MILGYSWLCHHNPNIDLWTREVKLTSYHEECKSLQKKSVFAWLVENEEQDIQYQVLEIIKHLKEDRDITVGQVVNDNLKNSYKLKENSRRTCSERISWVSFSFQEKEIRIYWHKKPGITGLISKKHLLLKKTDWYPFPMMNKKKCLTS